MNAKSEYIMSVPVKEQAKRGKIRMYPSGRYVNPFKMRASDIDISDIAHHLSLVNRYTGGSPFPYSVAAHSVWVSNQFGDRDLALAGLLHDAAEAYFNDMASPVKHNPAMAGYVQGITVAEKLIFATFGLDWSLMARTKEMDELAFKYEVKTFYESDTLKWYERVPELSWRDARDQFLIRYAELRGHTLLEHPVRDLHRPMEYT